MKRLGMFSLRRRRLRGDMTEVFKMIHGIDEVNLGKFFLVHMRMEERENSFCLRIKRHVNPNTGLTFLSRSFSSS